MESLTQALASLEKSKKLAYFWKLYVLVASSPEVKEALRSTIQGCEDDRLVHTLHEEFSTLPRIALNESGIDIDSATSMIVTFLSKIGIELPQLQQ